MSRGKRHGPALVTQGRQGDTPENDSRKFTTTPPQDKSVGAAGLRHYDVLFGSPSPRCGSCGVPLEQPAPLCQQCIAWERHRQHTLLARQALGPST